MTTLEQRNAATILSCVASTIRRVGSGLRLLLKGSRASGRKWQSEPFAIPEELDMRRRGYVQLHVRGGLHHSILACRADPCELVEPMPICLLGLYANGAPSQRDRRSLSTESEQQKLAVNCCEKRCKRLLSRGPLHWLERLSHRQRKGSHVAGERRMAASRNGSSPCRASQSGIAKRQVIRALPRKYLPDLDR